MFEEFVNSFNNTDLWYCFDDAKKIKKNNKHHECGHIGMNKHNDLYQGLDKVLSFLDDEGISLKPLKYSDELTYSAAKFVDAFYGCSIDPDLIAYDGNDHEFL